MRRHNNGINGDILNAAMAQAVPQAPQMVLATPINDVQLVALLAVRLPGESNKERVTAAIDLVAEACVQCKGGKALAEIIKAKQALLLQP